MADQHNDTQTTSFSEKRGWVNLKCGVCGISFWVRKSHATKRLNCSRQCQYIATAKRLTGKFGKDASFFRKGWHVDQYGYKQVLVSGPKRVKGGYRYRGEHILKAEKALGRQLKRNECVHHIDCNTSNNDNTNLLVCERGYHSWLHWEMSRKYGQIVLNGGA